MFAKCSLRDILRAALRPRRQPTIRTRTHRVRPAVEWLEGRVVPALQLTYGGPGTALTLSDLVGTQDNVTVLDFAGNVLQISLNGAAFAPGSSTAHVIYNNGTPGASSIATIDVNAANTVTTLTANLGALNDTLSLALTNASGGVGNVSV